MTRVNVVAALGACLACTLSVPAVAAQQIESAAPAIEPATATATSDGASSSTDAMPAPANIEAVAAAGTAPSLPLGTTIMIQLDAPVSSRTAVRGDMFPISLAESVRVDGVEIIPAGIAGEGQVVHSAGTGFGGRAGELIVAARYLMWGDRRIPLRGMRISTAGRNNTAEAIAVGQLIPFGGLFVTGTSVDLPAGQIAIARFAEDIPIMTAADLSATPSAAVAAAEAPASDPAAAATPISTEVQQGGTQ